MSVWVDVSPLTLVEAPASFSDVLRSYAVVFCAHYFWFGVVVGLEPGLHRRREQHGAWRAVRGHWYVRFVIRLIDERGR